ncbi:MAG TPA: hypothetical protein DCQ06_07125 [Myxococcales bacterium]|nr:hypothetical protein [Myxococcales bacterium]HAN31352.1 hypothetical protein [Myxococcales bacterium]
MARKPRKRSPHNRALAEDSSKQEAGPVRLQKVLSRAGIASRRGAEQFILDGRVSVNGVVVEKLGEKMIPGVDELRVDGERVGTPPASIVIVLNKPTGTLCSERDPEHRPLVHRLVPRDLALRTVGRLDFNTEGVLLLTNDGDLSAQLSHPRYGVHRTYEARVRGIPTAETLDRLVQGVKLDDGPARVESIQVIKTTDRNAWVRLTLTEGRNREVRRLMERVGHPVMRLRRTRFAGITADGLSGGQWRPLSDDEVSQLRERGHCGAFDLPPDPRRKGARAGGGAVVSDQTGRRLVKAKLKSESIAAARQRRKERRS